MIWMNDNLFITLSPGSPEMEDAKFGHDRLRGHKKDNLHMEGFPTGKCKAP